MWQITWMLGFIPDWFWTLLLFSGILSLLVAWVLKSVPIINNYSLVLRVGGVLAIIMATWFLGAASNEEKWKQRIAEVQQKLNAAQAAAAAANKGIETRVVTKTKIIKEKGEEIIQYVDREIVKYDNSCAIPKEVIKAHNDAAGVVKK